MAAASYAEALSRLLVHEGGYGNNPADPGGPTNFGITLADYRKYINANGNADSVRTMTVAQAMVIYRARYWDIQHCDELPPGVDYAIFDYGVNSGIGRSAKVLQRILGVAADGQIGPETIAAARARDPKVLVGAICDERLTFLRGLPTYPVFKGGWEIRVRDVRAAALIMAGKAQGVIPGPVPPISPSSPPLLPPWLSRMNAIMGLYEFPGGADNPAILAMAKACGGTIAKTYNHDAIPWCALCLNYTLIASGCPGTDSLLALSFRSYGRRLPGPAVGAIASQTRVGGGHVYLVVGRTSDGQIVGRGGNQADMVCDQVFPAQDTSRTYTWPTAYPLPTNPGFVNLPLVTPAPKAQKTVVLPPPSVWVPGKAVVPVPKPTGPVVAGGGAGVAGVATWHEWLLAHPWELALFAAGGAMIVGGVIYLIRKNAASKQDAPTPGLVPVAV